jgi:hypothetical protein
MLSNRYFFLKTSIYYVHNIENYDTYDDDEKYETKETGTAQYKILPLISNL